MKLIIKPTQDESILQRINDTYIHWMKCICLVGNINLDFWKLYWACAYFKDIYAWDVPWCLIKLYNYLYTSLYRLSFNSHQNENRAVIKEMNYYTYNFCILSVKKSLCEENAEYYVYQTPICGLEFASIITLQHITE